MGILDFGDFGVWILDFGDFGFLKIILLVSFSSNFEKAFCYPFPTVSDRVGWDFGIWIVMLQ